MCFRHFCHTRSLKLAKGRSCLEHGAGLDDLIRSTPTLLSYDPMILNIWPKVMHPSLGADFQPVPKEFILFSAEWQIHNIRKPLISLLRGSFPSVFSMAPLTPVSKRF